MPITACAYDLVEAEKHVHRHVSVSSVLPSETHPDQWQWFIKRFLHDVIDS